MSAIPIHDERDDDDAIATVVAELRRLRAASQLSRYRGPAPRLPSRVAIGAIVESLVSALYPRHFGPPGVSARDADAFVLGVLAKTLPALRHQVSLALALEWSHARGEGAQAVDRRTRSRARFSPLCRKYAPCSARTCARASRSIRRPTASTRSSSAFLALLR